MRVAILIASILALGACSVPRGITGDPVVGGGELNRKPDCTEVTVLHDNPYIGDFKVCGELNHSDTDQDG
jgi:hypothetical protein